jgi:hypothetical protein
MKLQQLSLFLENRPGQVKIPCKALTAAGINILAMSLADTEQFGILRIIVRDWKKGREVLEKAGCVVKMTEVVAVEVEDKPGSLLKILDAFEKAKMTIEYMYAFNSNRVTGRATLAFRFDDPDAALAVLEKSGVNARSSIELL